MMGCMMGCMACRNLGHLSSKLGQPRIYVAGQILQLCWGQRDVKTCMPIDLTVVHRAPKITASHSKQSISWGADGIHVLFLFLTAICEAMLQDSIYCVASEGKAALQDPVVQHQRSHPTFQSVLQRYASQTAVSQVAGQTAAGQTTARKPSMTAMPAKDNGGLCTFPCHPCYSDQLCGELCAVLTLRSQPLPN